MTLAEAREEYPKLRQSAANARDRHLRLAEHATARTAQRAIDALTLGIEALALVERLAASEPYIQVGSVFAPYVQCALCRAGALCRVGGVNLPHVEHAPDCLYLAAQRLVKGEQ